ncbi:MAG TPA: vWA domain-containing protein, partial [Desulfurivibrionaceae bacterium]|nr:vWA domain-containing protein [Desulfurivibrionaceae bacterium]
MRIIVDISGSMKGNDPQNLRQPAVRLLAGMLPQGTQAGVWTFGQWVNMLVPHGKVDAAWRKDADAQSRKINSVALRTNLGAALATASDDYLSGEDLSNTDFILLTDGRVDLAEDPAVNAAERARILGPLLASLTARGATLHTVALSQEADLEMLEALASRSGGHFTLASSADGLNRAFLKALNAAVPQAQIPLDEEGFTVDGGVEEFTALIFWGEDETSATRALELINPAGDRLSKETVADTVGWAAEPGYDLITVTGPAAGQWRLDGELGEGSRVTVVSDLRMVVSPVPPSFTVDEPMALKIAFFEDESRILDADFLQVIDVTVRLTDSQGRSGAKVLGGDQPPADGIYLDQIESLPAAGDYQIEVIADGTTFSRRFSAVTRFIAPESATPEAAVPAESPAPAPEAVVETPPGLGDAQSAPVMPIDISKVEVAPAEAAADPEPVAPGFPLWLWGLAAGAGLILIGGGVWVWLRRKRARPAELGEEAGENAEPEEVGGADEKESQVPPVVALEPEPEPDSGYSDADDELDLEPDAADPVPEPDE